MIGQTLGHYRIEEQLGAGGMGVVYRATDSKLGRQVAIKVLPEKFARDPERLARFEREARLLAALNHPNIAAIHGLEEAGGVHYLVLELVPGEILKGPLPVEEALQVSRQIAEALEAAHEKGIVHRDLKPANIKITPEGKVKVLDFGLAKAMQGESSASVDLSQSPTVSAGTEAGVVMGTAGYMSPEQARGAHVDKRADIWAFGCVLFECLAGRRAFPGESFSDCVAAVLAKEPDWETLPGSTPPHLQALLRRCLQKDPQRRLRDIGDARLELEEAPAEVSPRPAVSQSPRLALGVAFAAAAVLAGLIGWRIWHTSPAPLPVARFTITLPPGEMIASDIGSSLAFSPDGTRLAYIAQRPGQRHIYVRALNQSEARLVPGIEHPVQLTSILFTADGQSLAFSEGLKYKKLSLSGGAAVAICDTPQSGSQGADLWPDGSVVTTNFPFGLARVLPNAPDQRLPLTQLDEKKEERVHRLPQVLPGGKAVLFTASTRETESFDDAAIDVVSLESGRRTKLIEGGSCGRYSPPGHLLYVRGGQLLAVPFDLASLAVTGSPLPVLENLLYHTGGGQAYYALSASGHLAYVPGPVLGHSARPVWVDRQGKSQRLPLPSRSYLHPRLSPDGRQLAIEISGPAHNLYLWNPERTTLTKLTFDGQSHWPVWTPDGKRLTFRSLATGIWAMHWMSADRSGPPEPLTSPPTFHQSGQSWSPDGRVLALTAQVRETSYDVFVLELDRGAPGARQPRPFVQTRFMEGSPKFSPDGRYLAYCSNESGRMEVYVTPYPGPGSKIQVSNDGGSDPAWRRQGGELYYRNGDKMMVVAVRTAPAFEASRPQALWEGHYSHGYSTGCGPAGPSSSNYDVTPDGRHFLMIEDPGPDVAPNQIHVVLNWTEELKRLAQQKEKK